MKKSLYEMQPDENADISEWKRWSLQLKARAMRAEEIQKASQLEVTAMRRDVAEKDGVLLYYKTKNSELENTIENMKNNKAYALAKIMLAIKGRLVSALNRLLKKNA